MNFDELLKNHLGEIGVYQAVLLLCISYLAVPGSFGSLDYIFVGAVPDFRCDVGDVNHLKNNFSSNELLKLISPRQVKQSSISVNADLISFKNKMVLVTSYLHGTTKEKKSFCLYSYV